jgi:xanthine/uracil/vitamin C permease (AzgA family)
MADDPLIQHDEEQEDVAGQREAQAANLFDLRRIIGGLLIIYGVILTIMGATDDSAAVAKAAGVRINLWAGLGMLVVGALFIVWALTRPLGEQLKEQDSGS